MNITVGVGGSGNHCVLWRKPQTLITSLSISIICLQRIFCQYSIITCYYFNKRRARERDLPVTYLCQESPVGTNTITFATSILPLFYILLTDIVILLHRNYLISLAATYLQAECCITGKVAAFLNTCQENKKTKTLIQIIRITLNIRSDYQSTRSITAHIIYFIFNMSDSIFTLTSLRNTCGAFFNNTVCETFGKR